MEDKDWSTVSVVDFLELPMGSRLSWAEEYMYGASPVSTEVEEESLTSYYGDE